ncbi:MAG: hypothetical protein V4726_05400 [Verrucomicrobiota bacterium]
MASLRVIVSWAAFCYINFCALSWMVAVARWQLWHFNNLPGGLLPDFPAGSGPPRWTEMRMARVLSLPLWMLLSLFLIGPAIGPWLHKVRKLRALSFPDESRLLTANAIARWLLVLLPVLAACGLLPGSAFEFLLDPLPDTGDWRDPNVFKVYLRLLAPAIVWIIIVLLVAPELILLASARFTGFIDNVFFPGSREKKPPYTLKLARFYVQKQRWDDAEAEYARMLSFYPDQLEAWKESLHVAFAQGENADPAPDAILSKGLKKLKTPAEKEALFATFNAKEKPVIVPEPENF